VNLNAAEPGPLLFSTLQADAGNIFEHKLVFVYYMCIVIIIIIE